jgi:hypothetical protein
VKSCGTRNVDIRQEKAQQSLPEAAPLCTARKK